MSQVVNGNDHSRERASILAVLLERRADMTVTDAKAAVRTYVRAYVRMYTITT